MTIDQSEDMVTELNVVVKSPPPSAQLSFLATRVLFSFLAEAAAKESPDILDLKWYIVFGVLGFLMVVLIIVVVVICRNRGKSFRNCSAINRSLK